MAQTEHREIVNARIEQRLAQAEIYRRKIIEVQAERREHVKALIANDGNCEEFAAEIEQYKAKLTALTRSADWIQETLNLAGPDFEPLA